MAQVEGTTHELHAASDRLREVEGQRLAAVREADALRAQLLQLDSAKRGLEAGLKERCVRRAARVGVSAGGGEGD